MPARHRPALATPCGPWLRVLFAGATLNPVFDAPIPEVSGACFVGDRLVIVGDSKPHLAWTAWQGRPTEWDVLDVGELPGAPADTGQCEAVEHIHGSVVGVLCEEPALLIAVDLDARAVVATWRLTVEQKALRKAWVKDPNSRGEGLVFGPDRVYITKEKKPALLIEFGPPGATAAGPPQPGPWVPAPAGELTALASWDLSLTDVSDACVHEGRIWLLSDQDSCFGPMGGSQTGLNLQKAEGLARTPEGTWLVAVDNRDGRGALWVLE